jgi:hypothetical protein
MHLHLRTEPRLLALLDLNLKDKVELLPIQRLFSTAHSILRGWRRIDYFTDRLPLSASHRPRIRKRFVALRNVRCKVG